MGDGLERLWTGLGSLLSRHNRWKITFVFTVITVLALAGDDLLSFLVLTMELIGDVSFEIGEGDFVAIGCGRIQLLLCGCNLVGCLQQKPA